MSILSNSISAGLVLIALSVLEQAGLSAPTASEVIEALNVPRSSAYAAKKLVEQAVGQIETRPGRPARPPRAESHESCEISRAVLRYLSDHPGAVSGSQAHRYYSDGFRAFVLGLAQIHSELSIAQVAEAGQMPVPTLKMWMRVPAISSANDLNEVAQSSAPSASSSALDPERGGANGTVSFSQSVRVLGGKPDELLEVEGSESESDDLRWGELLTMSPMWTNPIVDEALHSQGTEQASASLRVHVCPSTKSAASPAKRSIICFAMIGMHVVVIEQLAIWMVIHWGFCTFFVASGRPFVSP